MQGLETKKYYPIIIYPFNETATSTKAKQKQNKRDGTYNVLQAVSIWVISRTDGMKNM